MRINGSLSPEISGCLLTIDNRFGNIVTMEWWDYLYLNEGFATVSPNRRLLFVYSWPVALQLMGEVVIMDK